MSGFSEEPLINAINVEQNRKNELIFTDESGKKIPLLFTNSALAQLSSVLPRNSSNKKRRNDNDTQDEMELDEIELFDKTPYKKQRTGGSRRRKSKKHKVVKRRNKSRRRR
jgi:prophage tail gpP-like protein